MQPHFAKIAAFWREDLASKGQMNGKGLDFLQYSFYNNTRLADEQEVPQNTVRFVSCCEKNGLFLLYADRKGEQVNGYKNGVQS